MQKKYWISLCIIAAALVTSMLFLNSPTTVQEQPTCCKKATKECSDSKKTVVPAETTLEHLSHQFIVAPIFIN